MSGRPTHRRRAAWLAGAVLLVGVLGPFVAPYDPTTQHDLATLANHAPSRAWPLGTDPFARDVLSRTLHAARVSMGVAGAAAAIATAAGAAWGLAAGSAGAAVSDAAMRLVDAARAVPRVVVLLAAAAAWEPLSLAGLALALGLTGWMATSRLVYAEVRAVRARDFVLAAQAMGAGALHVQLRHVLPHVGPTIATAAALAFGEAVSLEAGLSFLGLGVRPPTPSWGSMVDDGRPFLATAWWTTAVPAACIVLVTLAAVRVSELLEGRPASALRVAGLTGGRDAR